MRIRMQELVEENSTVLSGSLKGRQTFALLLDRVDWEAGGPEIIYLDFLGIEVATASFLRECILEFRDSVRRRWTNYYPVIANANEGIVEELSVLLASQRNVLMLCLLDKDDNPSSPRLLGKLEPKQRVTFDLVNELGEADAAKLMRRGNDSIGQTAWNNRLATLVRIGLLMELSHGRAKRYLPLPLGA